MANEYTAEYYSDYEDLGPETRVVKSEFVEDECPNPEIEVVEAELVEDEPAATAYEERVLFQVNHRASGCVWIATASSIEEAIYLLRVTADIMAEAGCEWGPLQEGSQAPEVPYIRLAQWAHEYCWRKEATALKEVVADQALEIRLFKK